MGRTDPFRDLSDTGILHIFFHQDRQIHVRDREGTGKVWEYGNAGLWEPERRARGQMVG